MKYGCDIGGLAELAKAALILLCLTVGALKIINFIYYPARPICIMGYEHRITRYGNMEPVVDKDGKGVYCGYSTTGSDK